jgi:hypothetical protein
MAEIEGFRNPLLLPKASFWSLLPPLPLPVPCFCPSYCHPTRDMLLPLSLQLAFVFLFVIRSASFYSRFQSSVGSIK